MSQYTTRTAHISRVHISWIILCCIDLARRAPLLQRSSFPWSLSICPPFAFLLQTTFCDSKLRISRGVARFPSAPTELRIFARDDADQKEWESWQEEEDAKTEASSATAWEEADNDDPYEKYFDEMPD